MRILMLNYEFPPLGGGASPVFYEIAKGYVKLGHSVTVVTMGFKGLSSFEVVDGINVYRVKCLRRKKEICTPLEMLTYVISAKRFLKKHLKNKIYDINHTHFIIPTGIISLWAKKRYGLNYILTAHGSDVLGYNPRFKKIYPLLVSKWKKIINESKIVTTPTKFLQNEINKITLNGNFIIIPNGIDTNKFKPMKKEKKILIVARLFKSKGVQDILDALNSISKELKQKGWGVDIVGEGPYRKFLEKKLKENNLQDIVKFHGWIDNKNEKMKGFYSHASVFINASFFENMSLTLLEALASGCKVLASNIGGNPEVVNKDCLFEVGDIKSLSAKIRKAINLKNQKVLLDKKFDWNKIIKEYVRALI